MLATNITDIAVCNPVDSGYYQADITGSDQLEPDIKLTPRHDVLDAEICFFCLIPFFFYKYIVNICRKIVCVCRSLSDSRFQYVPLLQGFVWTRDLE